LAPAPVVVAEAQPGAADAAAAVLEVAGRQPAVVAAAQTHAVAVAEAAASRREAVPPPA
jgi:hypothetical protein